MARTRTTAEARWLLGRVCRRFTERVDSPDLARARALLAAMRPAPGHDARPPGARRLTEPSLVAQSRAEPLGVVATEATGALLAGVRIIES